LIKNIHLDPFTLPGSRTPASSALVTTD